MDVLTLVVALLALMLSICCLFLLLLERSRSISRIANMAAGIVALKKERDEAESEKGKAGEMWQKGIDGIMAYELKNYGLNVDFLKTTGDDLTDG